MKKFRILIPLLIWSASCGAAFYVGRVSIHSETTTTTAAARAASSQTAGRTQFAAANSPANQPAPANINLQDILNGTGRIDRNLIRQWADGLSPEQLALSVADLQKLPVGDRRDEIIRQIVDSWSRRDPESFLSARDKITNPRTRENGVTDALQSLASVNPKAAMSWLAESADAVPNQLLARRYREAVQGIAESDPAAALDIVKDMKSATPLDQQIKRQSLNALADSLAQDGRYNDALQAFASLSPEDRNTASERVLGRWADDSPTAASAYVATVEDPALRTQMAERVAQSWARNDPQSAATWAASFEQATGQTSGTVLADAVQEWARYDLNGPAQFLNTLPKGPATDQAITAFTMQARNVDPATAMSWATNISDPGTRERVSGVVALQWMASDPTSFTQNAANMNSLSDQQKQWLNNLSQNPQLLERINQRINQNGNNLQWLGGNRGQNNGNNQNPGAGRGPGG